MRLLYWCKLLVAIFVLGGGLALVAVVVRLDCRPAGAFRAVAAEPDAAAQRDGDGTILVERGDRFVLITPNGKQVGELPRSPDRQPHYDPVLSPDCKQVASILRWPPPPAGSVAARTLSQVSIRAIDGKGPECKLAIDALSIAWAPDGKGLLAVEYLPAEKLHNSGFNNWLVDLSTKGKTRLDLSPFTQVSEMTPDGKVFVALVYDVEEKTDKVKAHLALVSRNGKEVTKLTEVESDLPPKIAPDGTRILFADCAPEDKGMKRDVPHFRLFIWDLGARKRVPLADVPLNASIIKFCWSPDSKRVAYTWVRVDPGVPPEADREIETHVTVADADGKNAKTLMSAKLHKVGFMHTGIRIGSVDWR